MVLMMSAVDSAPNAKTGWRATLDAVRDLIMRAYGPSAAGILVITLALSGCSTTTSGEASRASQPPAAEAPSRPIEQLSPTVDELSQALNSTMKITLPVLSSNSIKVLPEGVGDASPVECVGAKRYGMRQTYAQARVLAAATGSWETNTHTDLHIRPDYSVDVAIVEVDTATAAQTLLRKFVSQWQKCQTTPVVSHNVGTDGNTFTDRITQVTDTNGTLSAIDMQSEVNKYGIETGPTPIQRTVATASRYLIDVQVENTGWLPGNPISTTNAEAVAKLITAKIDSVT